MNMNMKRVAINGFGRIGRTFLRLVSQDQDQDPEVEVVAVNDIALNPESAAYLLQYDSVYRRFPAEVGYDEEGLYWGSGPDSRRVRLLAEGAPEELPWGELGVDVVIEATGVFRDPQKAEAHLKAGAGRVLLSAPMRPVRPDVPTIVYGVNHQIYDPQRHRIVSAASCTTNCLAPLAYVLHREFGIKHGLMTTVHAYTAAQRLVDAAHRESARGRAAAINIVPTKTGAAEAVGLVIPELEGRLTGMAMRVPTPTGSVTDLTATLKAPVTKEQVNEAFRRYAQGDLEGILAVSDWPLVSSDCVGDPHSAIVDLRSTKVLEGTFVKVIAFYDNEWGYARCLRDLVKLI